MVRQTSLLTSPPKRQIYKPAQITDEESSSRRDKHFTLGYVNFRFAGTSGLQGEKFPGGLIYETDGDARRLA